MYASTRLLRSQISFFKPFYNGCSIETTRKGQDILGAIAASKYRKNVICKGTAFSDFTAEKITPRIKKSNGVFLYLHGGGYVCGKLEYAKAFGITLSAKNGIDSFCAAYRLAPENPFPSALYDALCSFMYLRKSGYEAKNIILCGESAGGGLIYALTFLLKQLKEPLPGGIIAISPWTDLTLSGKSYEYNEKIDPSMTRERLLFYADMYAKNKTDPFVSPIFADTRGFPPSLIFAGGDEILLDDARTMHENLIKSGCKSTLTITPEMWHGYILYGVKEAEKDHDTIRSFTEEILNG